MMIKMFNFIESDFWCIVRFVWYHEDYEDHEDNWDHKNHNDQFIDAKDHDEILEVTFGALSDLWPETPFLILLPASKHTWEIAGTANFWQIMQMLQFDPVTVDLAQPDMIQFLWPWMDVSDTRHWNQMM